MASKPRQQPIAVIQIRDSDVAVAVADIKKTFDQAGVTHFSEELAFGAGRNLARAFELVGLSTGVLSAGLVASLSAMTASLGKFAQKQMTLRNTADSINLTVGELKQLINIGVAQGLSPEEAQANIVAFARAVLDLRRGVDSDTRRKLEERGAFGSGTIIARQLQERLREQGDRPYNIMRDILRQMSRGATGGDQDRLATQIWREVFSLGGAAWNQAYDHIEEFGSETIATSEEPLINFLLLKAEQEREMMNFWAQLREAALPALEKLSTVLGDWMESENFPAFIARVRKWAENLRDQPWDQIRKGITGTEGTKSKLARLGSSIVRALVAFGRVANTVMRWHRGPSWPGKAVPHLETQQLPFGQPSYQSNPSNTDWRASVNIQSQRQQQNPIMVPGQTGVREPTGGGTGGGETGGGKTDLAAALGLGGLERMAEERGIKLDKTPTGDEAPGPFHFVDRPSLVHFQRDLGELQRELHDTVEMIDVDRVKIRIGRTSGGDLGVSEKSRSPPMDTDAGGAEGIQLKKKPARGDVDPFAYLKHIPMPSFEREETTATRLRALGKTSPLTRLGLQESRITTYDELRLSLQHPDTKEEHRTRYEDTMKGAFGFSYPTVRTIYYNTDQNSPLTTLAHEGGHVGRTAVEEAGKKDPTLRGYGVSLGAWKEGPKEEIAQRHLDLREAKSLREQGVIGEEEYNVARDRALGYLARGGLGPFGTAGASALTDEEQFEMVRHSQMYQHYAERLLNVKNKTGRYEVDLPPIDLTSGRRRQDVDNALRGFSGDQHQLDLGVNVRAAPGTQVETNVTDGTLMSNEGTTVSREMTLQ